MGTDVYIYPGEWPFMGSFQIIDIHVTAVLQRMHKIIVITSSNGNIFSAIGHLCGDSSCPRWIPHTKAIAAELWCVWINNWVNNREAGDLRRHCAHYDFIVMLNSKFHRNLCICQGKMSKGYIVYFGTSYSHVLCIILLQTAAGD